MTSITAEPLIKEKQDKVKAWLVSPESQWVEEIIKGQIADTLSKASNQAMEQAAGVIASRDVPNGTKELFTAAAVLQLFLSTLDVLRKTENFARITITIQ